MNYCNNSNFIEIQELLIDANLAIIYLLTKVIKAAKIKNRYNNVKRIVKCNAILDIFVKLVYHYIIIM